jgi:hypothetical protein
LKKPIYIGTKTAKKPYVHSLGMIARFYVRGKHYKHMEPKRMTYILRKALDYDNLRGEARKEVEQVFDKLIGVNAI